MTPILDQQFVAHLFAPAEGPGAAAAYRAMDEIWSGCGLLFQMTDPIPGINLPHLMPSASDALCDGEVALAARERPNANCQAVLRVHHDVLNLSIALAPPEALAASVPAAADEPVAPSERAVPPGGAGEWQWWRTFDYQWGLLTAPHAPHLLGEARLYLARVDAEPEIRAADPELYASLSSLLPGEALDPAGPLSRSTGVVAGDGLAFWETSTEPDERALRRFVLAIAPDADPVASAWAWSRGDTAIPPLARYLVHAAKLRYELRVWQRDSQARELRVSLGTLGEELRRGRSDPAGAYRLRLRRLDALILEADLRDLRHTVEIAADNLRRAFDLTGLLMAGGPFADDTDLASSLLERLDDEVAYLGLAAERAQLSGGQQASPEPAEVTGADQTRPGADTGPSENLRRNVLVIHGRDKPARRAVFEFLRSLDLRPLEWEMLVRETERSAPSLSETVRRGLAIAQAVVVLMTPDDVVHLHSELQEPGEPDTETKNALQARPNVLLELGMALISHPNRTLILFLGEHRSVTDLGGINFVRVTDTIDCRHKIVSRLRSAGCLVEDSGEDWLIAGDFSKLAAYHRKA